jgi:hypothetical protein
VQRDEERILLRREFDCTFRAQRARISSRVRQLDRALRRNER